MGLKEAMCRYLNTAQSLVEMTTSSKAIVLISIIRTGLRIIPALLPPSIQRQILSSLLLRDLADTKTHATNLHLHYKIPTPFPFFSASLEATLDPIDPKVHKPLTMTQVLNKKLRWMTLGGQYDWTAKKYPEKVPGDEPAFPADVGNLIHGLVRSPVLLSICLCHSSFIMIHSHVIVSRRNPTSRYPQHLQPARHARPAS